MKTIILTKADKNNNLKCLMSWWNKPLLDHLLTNLLFFKLPRDIYIVGVKNAALESYLEKYSIPKKNYIILLEQGTEVDSLLTIKYLIEEDPLFLVIDSNSYFPKKDVRRIIGQEELNYPVIFTYKYQLPYAVIGADGRDNSIRTMTEAPEMTVNTGVYILPKEIWRILSRFDTITEALFQLKLEVNMKIYTFDLEEWRYFAKRGDFIE